jgi:AmmeMemoRadiSam system protein A
MAPSPLAETRLRSADARTLLELADHGIIEGLEGRRPDPPPAHDLPVGLQANVGTFVTLLVRGALNGCIGTIEAADPLGVAVHRLARAAAFADPRLPSLTRADYDQLTIEVSVLSPLSSIDCSSRDALRDELAVGLDGVLIGAGRSEGVFLPSVWEQLPDADAFLDHLYRKAGIEPGAWPTGMRAWRFSVEKYRRESVAPATTEGRPRSR